MSNGLLRVNGDKVVDASNNVVILRGSALGGWMNQENFIVGYPGHEHQFRTSLAKTVGPEKADFFFDRFLHHFFTDSDAAYFASLGLNCLRLPFNYRHFEDDMNPRVLKESGFKHLDRVVDICARHGIYTILDLHTAPGGQNGDWHSDNATNHAGLWEHKDHQDRVVWLWQQLAAHYKGNAWVAGYNPLNEPCDPLHHRLPKFYARLEKAIREVDPEHILWLDGNTFSMEWKYFDTGLPNTVYALHDYAQAGFNLAPPYEGTAEEDKALDRQFCRKAEAMYRLHTPIYNGEFGPVYAGPDQENHKHLNERKYALLETQLGIYDKYAAHWSVWLYKDVGLQGMTYLDPESKWMRAIAPFQKRKRDLQLDAWGRMPSEQVTKVIGPLVEWIDKVAPTSKDQYPTPWATERQITRLINQCWLSGCLSDEFAGLFKGMSEEELEECAKSWSFENCVKREELGRRLGSHGKQDIGKDWERPRNTWLDAQSHEGEEGLKND
ncbi:glycoside hydrolase family 5 protein [Myriangium duriaei CBS 260.36]|uniref:Glycoside hydrolase family 5 protein n=1 Tax=Myriangium duriaei CBS 260.36 TaxID=1168546 RepID=A0A9P4J6K0_9PEZI|nr:glycoside hydrolase family 5 protein [Myriangium duriaei CBS 260.36]